MPTTQTRGGGVAESDSGSPASARVSHARVASRGLHSRSASGSSEDGLRESTPAARRFARRRLRPISPTPDLVTSLVRPPSPDAGHVTPRLHDRARQEAALSTASSWSRVTTSRRAGPTLVPHLSSLDIPRRYGGSGVFDMYALSYVVDPDPSLLCPICHDPLVDPVTTPCDHTFCYRCLRRSIASSPSGSVCPVDREPLSWLDCSSAARLIRAQLSNLRVRCPHHGRGCSRQLRREAVEAHATLDCAFREVACPSPDCREKLPSRPSSGECEHHLERCSLCDEDIVAADRQQHLLSCAKGKTRCEACWLLVCRSQLARHREADCDGIEVPCPYQDLGCPVRVARAQADSHTVACAFHPDTPSGSVIRSQRELIRSYREMESQLEQVRARQNDACERIEEIMTTLSQHGGTDALAHDNRTMQDLDTGFEEVHQNLTQLEARQSMWTMTQVMPIREEVTELRNNINMIRMHVNWLLNRSREEGRIRAAHSAGTSSTLRRDGSGEAAVLPERRRSSGAEADLPRL